MLVQVGKASQDRDPVDGFALMEDGFAAGLCCLVDNSLTAIKKVGREGGRRSMCV